MQIKTDRQYYIDWLRVGAMFLLVFYHSGRLFDGDAWHIKNTLENKGIDVFNRILDIWQMPLFFLVAGAAVWFSMGNRGAGTFAKERVLRLLVPLIWGMLVIVPPQVYLQRISEGTFTGSFWAWWPHTFQPIYSMDNPASGNLSWHHLWFLAYLFVFSMLLIPAFRYFRREDKKPLIEKIAWFFNKPWAIFLPIIPLVIINITLRPIYGGSNQNLFNDWANFLFYIVVFFSGFLMVSNNRITQAIKRQTFVSLVAALVFFTLYALIKAEIVSAPRFIFDASYAIDCWLWLMVFVGLGMRWLNFSNRLLDYANNAVLPVYILHQTMIISIGYFVIQWDWPVAGKYPFIVASVFVSSLLIYEIVRRIGVTRFFFGIKTRAAKKLIGKN